MKCFFLAFSILLFVGCKSDSESISPVFNNVKQISYSISNEDFPNPERGFYRATYTSASNYTLLQEENLVSYRAGNTPQSATYSTKSTLIYRNFVLNDFINSDISQEFLDNIQTDFNTVASAGFKMIVRFSYTITPNSGNCADGNVCPPYGDASKERVLAHINQLSPVLTSNSHLIATLQMGFIGIWGENFYTDYFGDSSENGTNKKLIDENWQDRIEVLKTLLDVTPKTMMIQVRYPQMKQRFVYGINAPTSSEALIMSEAFSGSDKARIGFHNDCFLASEDDLGTYFDYGNSATSPKPDIQAVKKYVMDDGVYVPVGGETCSDAFSPQNNCSGALSNLQDLHYSFLNAEFNNEVNNDWESGGCIEDIKRNLGYRFSLSSGAFSEKVTVGEKLNFELTINNTGYTTPYHERRIYVVFRNTSTKVEYSINTQLDARNISSSLKIQESFDLPNGIVSGNYQLFLHFPDGGNELLNNPLYSIQLANTNVWESDTGYNNLNHTVLVD